MLVFGKIKVIIVWNSTESLEICRDNLEGHSGIRQNYKPGQYRIVNCCLIYDNNYIDKFEFINWKILISTFYK